MHWCKEQWALPKSLEKEPCQESSAADMDSEMETLNPTPDSYKRLMQNKPGKRNKRKRFCIHVFLSLSKSFQGLSERAFTIPSAVTISISQLAFPSRQEGVWLLGEFLLLQTTPCAHGRLQGRGWANQQTASDRPLTALHGNAQDVVWLQSYQALI